MSETKGKGKLICRVNNFALLMEDLGEGPVFIAVIVDEKGDIIGSTQLDLTLAVFFERCLGAAISEILGHSVRENYFNGEKAKNNSEGRKEED